MNELPPHLAHELGRWHDREQTLVLITQYELFEVPVVVKRLYLGDPKAEGFGTVKEVYRSKEKSTP